MNHISLSHLLSALAFAGALAVGCQKAASPGGGDGAHGEEVMIAPSVLATTAEDGSSGVGAVDGIDEEVTLYFMRADNVVSTGAGYTATYDSQMRVAVRTKGPDKQSLAFTVPGAQYYKMDGSNTLMRGWYPAGTFVAAPTATVTWTINGAMDVMVSDKLVGNYRDKGINGPDHWFTFRHALTQLQFHVSAETASIAQSWGKVKGIKVKRQNSSCMFMPMMADMGMFDELVNPVFTFTAPQADLSAYGIPSDGVAIPVAVPGADEVNGAAAAGAIMIQPGQQSYTVEVTVQLPDGMEDTVEVVVPDPDANPKPAFAAGEATKVILDFQPRDINVTLVPADWTVVSDSVELGVAGSGSE